MGINGCRVKSLSLRYFVRYQLITNHQHSNNNPTFKYLASVISQEKPNKNIISRFSSFFHSYPLTTYTEFLFLPLFSGCILTVEAFFHKLYLSNSLRSVTHIFCLAISLLSYGMCRILLIHDKYKQTAFRCFQVLHLDVDILHFSFIFLIDVSPALALHGLDGKYNN